MPMSTSTPVGPAQTQHCRRKSKSGRKTRFLPLSGALNRHFFDAARILSPSIDIQGLVMVISTREALKHPARSSATHLVHAQARHRRSLEKNILRFDIRLHERGDPSTGTLSIKAITRRRREVKVLGAKLTKDRIEAIAHLAGLQQRFMIFYQLDVGGVHLAMNLVSFRAA
jgi:hypothetical protein